MCDNVTIGFFFFNWLRKDVARDSFNSNNIIFRIKVLRFENYEIDHKT